MNDGLNLLKGVSGMAGVEFIDVVTIPSQSTIELVGKVLIQVAIGIVTILGLLKKKRDNK